MNRTSDIHDFEVPNLVNKLIRFIGRAEIEKCLDRYKWSLQSSGPVLREYYLKTRHPWWEAFIEYLNLEKSGKSIKRNLTNKIKILAGDAKKISVLQRLMPEKVKEKYKKDLEYSGNIRDTSHGEYSGHIPLGNIGIFGTHPICLTRGMLFCRIPSCQG